MTDSTMYSSLFALVDSHLSKTSVQDNEEDISNQTITLPQHQDARLGSQSESSLPSQPYRSFPKSPFDTSESPNVSVLTRQVENMLKAKEVKKQLQEKLKLEEELKQLKIEEENNAIVDLMKALLTPYPPGVRPHAKESLSKSSSSESLSKLNIKNGDDKEKTPEPVLPCITDMSYILEQKIKRSKGSPFGRVLSSRLEIVAAPYLGKPYPSSIVRFDFNTPSPCDLVKERLRRPTMSCTCTTLEDFMI